MPCPGSRVAGGPLGRGCGPRGEDTAPVAACPSRSVPEPPSRAGPPARLGPRCHSPRVPSSCPGRVTGAQRTDCRPGPRGQPAAPPGQGAQAPVASEGTWVTVAGDRRGRPRVTGRVWGVCSPLPPPAVCPCPVSLVRGTRRSGGMCPGAAGGHCRSPWCPARCGSDAQPYLTPDPSCWLAGPGRPELSPPRASASEAPWKRREPQPLPARPCGPSAHREVAHQPRSQQD